MPRIGRSYLLLFTSSVVSNLGDGITLVAFPLLVATLTRDPTTVAGIVVVTRLPWLLFALPVGALTDRLDRKRVMWQANFVRFVAMAGLAAAVAAGEAPIWLLYVLALVVGVAEVFYDNAAQTFLPQIVASSLLPRANGRLIAGETVANQFLGPPLGAALFALAGAIPFAVDAATFALTVPLLLAIPGSFRVAPAEPAATRHLGREILAGLRWLWGHRLIRLLALLLGLVNFSASAVFSVLVLYAQDELGVGDLAFALLITAGAVGAVAGGVSAGRLTDRFGPGPLLVVAYFALAATPVLLGTLPVVGLAVAVMAVEGCAGAVWNVITVSLRQTIIPAPLLGRVNSVYRFIGWGSIPLGALAAGILAALWGVTATYIIIGVGLPLIGLAVARPLLTLVDAASADGLEGDEAAAVQDDGGTGHPAT